MNKQFVIDTYKNIDEIEKRATQIALLKDQYANNIKHKEFEFYSFEMFEKRNEGYVTHAVWLGEPVDESIKFSLDDFDKDDADLIIQYKKERQDFEEKIKAFKKEKAKEKRDRKKREKEEHIKRIKEEAIKLGLIKKE